MQANNNLARAAFRTAVAVITLCFTCVPLVLAQQRVATAPAKPPTTGAVAQRIELAPGESNAPSLDAEGGVAAVVITLDDMTAVGGGGGPLGITNAVHAVKRLFGLPIAGIYPADLTVSGEAFTGALTAGGGFDTAFAPIRIPTGAILSSGSIHNVNGWVARSNVQPNTSANNGQPGNALLNAIVAPNATADAAMLEFDISTNLLNGRILKFRYVFASEEHPEFSGSGYNDACGIFATGPGFSANLALVPRRSTDGVLCGGPAFVPVTVNNVNLARNAGCFLNNDSVGYPCVPPPTPANRDTEMDGLTRPFLSQQLPMAQNVTYHIKLKVADTSRWGTDRVYDSNCFFRGYFTGACVTGTGAECICEDAMEQVDCEGVGGTYYADTECKDIAPSPCSGAEVPGKCCLPTSKDCIEVTQAQCTAQGGTYAGKYTTCQDIGACTVDASCVMTAQGCCTSPGSFGGVGSTCPADPAATGVCCMGTTCTETTEEACQGTYLGDGTSCDGDIDPCLGRIPAVSEWGMVVLVMLVLAAGTVVIRRARALRAHT